MAPGTRLIVPPEGSRVLEELKTPHVKALKNSPKQDSPAKPHAFSSPTGMPEITLPGPIPNDASGMMSGGFGKSGIPGGVGFVFVNRYAPLGSTLNLTTDWAVPKRAWVWNSRCVERLPEPQNPCTWNGVETPE